MGTLLYSMASRLKDTKRLAFLSESIAQRKICTELQLAGKLSKFWKSNKTERECLQDTSETCCLEVMVLRKKTRGRAGGGKLQDDVIIWIRNKYIRRAGQVECCGTKLEKQCKDDLDMSRGTARHREDP